MLDQFWMELRYLAPQIPGETGFQDFYVGHMNVDLVLFNTLILTILFFLLNSLLHETISTLRIVLPKHAKNIELFLNNPGVFSLSLGIDKELKYCLHTNISIQRIVLPNHPNLAKTLAQCAKVYEDQGKYKEAEPLYKEAIDIARIALPENHPDLATHLNNQARLYGSQGRYKEAEDLLNEAISIARIALPQNHPHLATFLQNLAKEYDDQGKYKEAEAFFNDAIAIARIALPQNHPHLAHYLNNLARFYCFRGKYKEAEPLLNEAIAIDRIALPENHPSLAKTLNNLAELYLSQGRYSEAEPLFNDALAIARIALPENHPDLSLYLHSLAGLYYNQGRYAEAEPLFNDALAIFRITLPENHPKLAQCLNNLAGLYYNQGRYSEAEPLYSEAIAIDRIALPENHPNLASHLNNLAELYYSQGRYKEMFEQLQGSLESENLRLRYIFSISPDRERREYLQKNLGTYYAFLNLVWQHLRDDSQAVSAALDAVLGRKGLTTAALAAQNAAIYSGRYSEEIQKIFRELQQCNEKILEATYAPPLDPELSPEAYEQQRKERRQRLADLQKKSEDLEKQLAKVIPELQLSQQEVNRDLVAAQLPDGSALVEFVQFKRHDFDGPKGEKWQEDRYIAFVVMAHQPERLRLVDLGEAEPLDKLIKTFRSYFVGAGDTFARRTKEWIAKKAQKQLEVDRKQLEVKRQLYQTLCQPLIKLLPSGSHCFLAPDSSLNLLPFQILPLSQNSDADYLRDQYRISYLNSGRDLLRQEIGERPLKVQPATILADPDYDWNGKKAREQGSKGAGEQGSTGAQGQGSLTLSTLSGFGEAKGTNFFGVRAGKLLGTKPYLRENAISRHLTHGDCPLVLAVATHGFYRTAEKPYVELIFQFLETEPGSETQLFKQNASLMNGQLLDELEQVAQYCETEYPQYAQKLRDLAPKIKDYIAKQPPQPPKDRLDAADADNPMYRGGIALAGANFWNQGGNLPDGNKGILFAQDVAALDLWGNELSALIACQTGLGEVASGDSVGGLRRAFVVSGSKTQVMSLWSVPARATCYLMECFFDHLKAGLGRAEALAMAQFDVRTVTAGVLRQSDLGREILQELTRDFADEDCPLSSPYYWGAWVLQGDISPLQVELYGVV